MLALLEGSLIGYDIGQHHGDKSSYQRVHRIIPLKLNICQRQAYDHTIVCQNSSRDFFHWCYKCYTSKKTYPFFPALFKNTCEFQACRKQPTPPKKNSFQVVVSKMFLFSPLPGEMIQFDERAYFSDGWLNNHQSSKSKCRATARPTKKCERPNASNLRCQLVMFLLFEIRQESACYIHELLMTPPQKKMEDSPYYLVQEFSPEQYHLIHSVATV